ncbi:UPF0553 protein C9orf64-like [Tropilaelaps mercedesae]|uniref:Queuosine 5'-phosphate N-glycosylase/hydrolase n=1 Tax=Tropilaelaps mercedesae TaxID=418985 RepID=A0A1V9XZY7_9ACAR|nr:UPF0553 protein C9orf64-like [Tropilaelaps mercedesae]
MSLQKNICQFRRDVLGPRESAAFIASQAEDVSVDPEGLRAVASKKFGGKFITCVRQCKKDAVKLVLLLVDEFLSFRDEAIYKGTNVSFYKRAQILVADLWSCFEGKSLGEFHNIDDLTMFADYRVPQVLVYFGAMQYTPRLAARLRDESLLENDSQEVCEIRGVAIHACELIRDLIRKEFGSIVNSILVDYFLWDYRRDHAEQIEAKGIPFHHVRCIYY